MTNDVKLSAAPKRRRKIASLDRRKARAGWLFVLPFVICAHLSAHDFAVSSNQLFPNRFW